MVGSPCEFDFMGLNNSKLNYCSSNVMSCQFGIPANPIFVILMGSIIPQKIISCHVGKKINNHSVN